MGGLGSRKGDRGCLASTAPSHSPLQRQRAGERHSKMGQAGSSRCRAPGQQGEVGAAGSQKEPSSHRSCCLAGAGSGVGTGAPTGASIAHGGGWLVQAPRRKLGAVPALGNKAARCPSGTAGSRLLAQASLCSVPGTGASCRRYVSGPCQWAARAPPQPWRLCLSPSPPSSLAEPVPEALVPKPWWGLWPQLCTGLHHEAGLGTHHKAEADCHHPQGPAATVPPQAFLLYQLLRDHISNAHQGPWAEQGHSAETGLCPLASSRELPGWARPWQHQTTKAGETSVTGTA